MLAYILHQRLVGLKRANTAPQVTINGQTMLEPLAAVDAIDYMSAGALSIVPGGTPDFAPRGTSATVERTGKLNTIIKITGSIL